MAERSHCKRHHSVPVDRDSSCQHYKKEPSRIDIGSPCRQIDQFHRAIFGNPPCQLPRHVEAEFFLTIENQREAVCFRFCFPPDTTGKTINQSAINKNSQGILAIRILDPPIINEPKNTQQINTKLDCLIY